MKFLQINKPIINFKTTYTCRYKLITLYTLSDLYLNCIFKHLNKEVGINV